MSALFPQLMILLSLAVKVTSVDEISRHDFPSGFIFGSATSAYQAEGAVDEDGRTPSIWDTFAKAEYFTRGNGDVTSNQYHKYKEDVQLMAEMGLDAYRFSISWSRLIPYGRGHVNPKGLQYYNSLINELISHGIQPHVTLHHIDLPQALEDEYGGWVDEAVVRDFIAFADVCFREFGDRVLHWTTMNAMNIYAEGGYDTGFSPPGRCSPPFGLINCTKGNSTVEPYLVVHNMLVAHASAARLYDKKYKAKQRGFIGTSIYTDGAIPLTDTKEDIDATQRFNDFYLGWILHPLVFGDYPDAMKKIVGGRLPAFTSVESNLVKGSSDFIGVIYYNTYYIKNDSSTLQLEDRDFDHDMAVQLILDGKSLFEEYKITPWGLEGVLEYIKQTYRNPPIYILENGQITPHNSLEDTARVEYLHAYIKAVLNAVRNGSNVRGYIQWSFMDVYELLTGFSKSFGLFYVDFNDPARRRYPKLSAHWYSRFLKGENVGPDFRMIAAEKNLLAVDGGQLSRYDN